MVNAVIGLGIFHGQHIFRRLNDENLSVISGFILTDETFVLFAEIAAGSTLTQIFFHIQDGLSELYRRLLLLGGDRQRITLGRFFADAR